VIVGIGVNVATTSRELAQVAALGTATSLGVAARRAIDRGQVLAAIVERMDVWLRRSPEELTAAWQARLWGRGQRLRLLDLGEHSEVVVLGAEADGALRVRLADGSERRTTTGEILL
jgi:biotin-(acetyl-CoA carboxylase) ligase